VHIEFKEKVVIVTGAAGVLGTAVSQAFLEAGAQVVYVDVAGERMDSVISKATQDPEHRLAIVANLMSAEEAERIASEVIERFGKVDILVNTVGGYQAGKPLHETPQESWDFMLDLNARTVYNACKAVIPYMLQKSSGSILSIAARPGLTGRRNMAAYSVSKSAVISMTESMAAELLEAGIRANCIIPGTIDTPTNRKDMPDADFNKWVKPESLAQVILFLSHDMARDVTGAALPVYGRTL
jgi:NAD(P)-dependent dehydrogenase (short-subunit alcohol dehydrogenase family)